MLGGEGRVGMCDALKHTITKELVLLGDEMRWTLVLRDA